MFLWRPRPPTLLSKDKAKEIKKNLKEYATEFSKQDELRENKALRMVVERRRALMDEWNAFRASAARRYEAVRVGQWPKKGHGGADLGCVWGGGGCLHKRSGRRRAPAAGRGCDHCANRHGDC